MPRKLFEKGNKMATGGARPNAGRRADEFRIWLRKAAHNPTARRRYIKILNDTDDADEKITDQGVCVPTRTKADTYLKAIELAWNYLEGRPAQHIHQTGLPGINILQLIREAEEDRGLPSSFDD
jgi:hypothetical protein